MTEASEYPHGNQTEKRSKKVQETKQSWIARVHYLEKRRILIGILTILKYEWIHFDSNSVAQLSARKPKTEGVFFK